MIVAHSRHGGSRPSCYACRQDEIYDHSARITRATVRAQVPFEPYVLSLCDHHLAQLQREFSGSSVTVTHRYVLFVSSAKEREHGNGRAARTGPPGRYH